MKHTLIYSMSVFCNTEVSQESVDYSILSQIFGRLSAEIKFFSTKLKATYSRDVPIISTDAVSLSSTNCSLSPAEPLSLMVFSTTILVQAENDDMKLHPSASDSVKVTSLMNSMEISTPLLKSFQHHVSPSLPSPSNNQSRNALCFITRKIKNAT